MTLYMDVAMIWKWIGNSESWLNYLGCLIVIFEVIFGVVLRRGSSELCIYMYYGYAYAHLRMYMLILMLWYIRKNVITHGADYKDLKYKRECDYVWINLELW